MTVFEFSNYRTFMKAALSERMTFNPGYSLRAFARDCKLGSSTISGALNGKSNLSVDAALKVAKTLHMKVRETNYLCDLVALELEKNPAVKENIISRLKQIHPEHRPITDLTVEIFKQLSDWYHSAILELPFVKNFRMSAENISKALSIPLPAAQLALERLKKLELLEEDESGNLKRSQPEIRIKSDVKNTAFRAFYRQMFKKASDALDEQTPAERLSGYLTVPMNPQALGEIDDLITKFFGDVREVSKKHENETDVYHLMIHFFNLTKRSQIK